VIFAYGLFVTIAPLKIQGKLILGRGIRQMSLNKTVVLIGMMGSGKTVVGKALAAELNVAFMDSDHEISVAANRSIAEIFERDGEAFFRSAESKIIERLLLGAPSVLSTGGGAFMSAYNRALISDLGVSVFLKVDLELLWERVRSNDTRPLLKTPNPKASLTQIFEDREDQYKLADVSVMSNASCSIAQTMQNILEALAQLPDVLSRRGDQS
jgi:shikimate kinase